MVDVIEELAQTCLNDDGRRRLEQVRDDLQRLGKAAWSERYPDLGEQFDARDPTHGELLVDTGVRAETIGWADWSGEDEENQVRDMTTEACRRLGLPDPAIPVTVSEDTLTGLGENARSGDFVPALLKAVDGCLAGAGLRLLGIQLDTDEFNFAPVTRDVFAALCNRGRDDLQLYDVVELSG